MMVRFTNINDPNSGEEVDPRNLATTMGPGVHLASVTFELTHDPVTPIPRIWPAWLKSQTVREVVFAHQKLWGAFGQDGIDISAFKGD